MNNGFNESEKRVGDGLAAVIEDALRTAPLEEAPASLAPRVMASLRIAEGLPRFRLNWLDYALSLFTAGMALLVVLLGRSLPSEIVLYLRLEMLHWVKSFIYQPLIPVLSLGAAALATGLFLVGAMFVLRFWPGRADSSETV